MVMLITNIKIKKVNLIVTRYLLSLVIVNQAGVAHFIGRVCHHGYRSANQPNFMLERHLA